MPVTLAKPKTQASPRAPQPAPPVRQFSFTDFQTNNPTAPPPGDRLDGEIDRANQAVTDTIAWASTSLNSDGSLKPFAVGKDQLQPGLFDHVANDAEARIAPLIDAAAAAADSVRTTASEADASALAAADQNARAQDAAGRSSSDAQDAATSAAEAAQSARDAQASADAADDSANHADLAENVCIDYGVLTEAWAEHMPDTIPPNILATMDVTGDHWSSRWWANHAAEVVDNAENNLDALGQQWQDTLNTTGQGYVDQLEENFYSYLESFQTLYLGAFMYAPISDAQGNPVATGALYYNTVLEAPYLWNGQAWVPFITPSPTEIYKYIYVATAGQTVFSGADRSGNVLAYNAANKQTLSTFKAGLLLTPTDDYTTAVNRVTLTAGATAGQIVQLYVENVPTIQLNWRTARLDTSTWTTTGGTLKDSVGGILNPANASDVMVSVDGVWQHATVDYIVSSSTLTFTTAHPADSVVFGIAIVPVQAPTGPPPPAVTGLDTSGWVFDGTTAVFSLVDTLGGAVTPNSSVNLLISLAGVWQAAETDYTVNGSLVTFTTAPAAGVNVFGLCGLPAFAS